MQYLRDFNYQKWYKIGDRNPLLQKRRGTIGIGKVGEFADNVIIVLFLTLHVHETYCMFLRCLAPSYILV